LELVGDLVVATVAALVGGLVAHRLRQPALVGYLFAGIIVGPSALGVIHAPEQVEGLAQIGVVLLLFAIGAELDFRALAPIRTVAIFGGLLQIAALGLIVLAAGQLLGLAPGQAVFVGFLLALSSTMAALKILDERGEMDTLPGRLALGMLLVQDLSVVPVAVLLPILSEPPDRQLVALGLAGIKAAVLLAAIYFLAARAIPRGLFRIAATGSSELFVLTVVSLALGTAVATEALGLSVALGAFVAGLVVARSDVSHRVLVETLPLRDIFAAMFFVSVGTAIDPRLFVESPVLIVALALALVAVKTVVAFGIIRAFGFAGMIALAAAATLAQVGEFSIVLGQLGQQAGLLGQNEYRLLLALSLVTIVLSAPLRQAVEGTGPLRRRLPLLGRLLGDPVAIPAEAAGLSQHTVICGHGRVGREVADALKGRGFQYLVIDLNPHLIADLRSEGVPCIYGDAAREEVLRHASLDRARGLVCTVPDRRATEAIVRAARQVSSRIDIIARARDSDAVAQLQRAGAAEVVYPEFEAGLEMIRHILHRYGVGLLEIQSLLQARRSTRYQRTDDQT
jgi:CPA2 family monovalent cation:H+ antiporter-2